MKILSGRFFAFAFVLSFFFSSGAGAKNKPKNELRVMSFNIRLGVANDGPNHWDLRKDLVVSTIRKFKPDLLGLQEVFPMQGKYLKDKFSEYAYYGRSRLVDPQNGEACSVMIRKDRFEVVEKSTFWLSKTQDEPGSKSWDSSLPRIANLIHLSDRKAGGQKLIFVNTHFDHRGKTAREEAAKIIKKRVGDLGDGARVVVAGDFNSGEGSKPYQSLVGGNLLDTFRIAKPKRTEEESTFTAWNGRLVGNRIDWLLCSPNLRVLSAEIDRTHFKGRYPSDHYPVTAVLAYGKETD
jgi:endonuclease/exonuclease/phosphatase family metal-dependent hydrolase